MTGTLAFNLLMGRNWPPANDELTAAEEICRELGLGELLTRMPGVRWADSGEDKLPVNLSVARFLNRPIFHLLGYRSRQRDKTHLLISNREHKAKNDDYKNTFWFSED